MLFPRRTSRLELRDLSAGKRSDSAALCTIVGWLNDAEVIRFSEQRHQAHNLATQIQYFDAVRNPDKYIGVFHEELLIGTMTIRMDVPNNVANVGIMMGEKTKWGQGFGFEAWSCICDGLFADGVRKIEAGCMGINYRMMALCQHYGMVEEGRQDKHFVIGQGTTDLAHWGKFNETT